MTAIKRQGPSLPSRLARLTVSGIVSFTLVAVGSVVYAFYVPANLPPAKVQYQSVNKIHKMAFVKIDQVVDETPEDDEITFDDIKPTPIRETTETPIQLNPQPTVLSNPLTTLQSLTPSILPVEHLEKESTPPKRQRQQQKIRTDKRPQKEVSPVDEPSQKSVKVQAKINTTQNKDPDYPRIAHDRGYEGTVVLTVMINDNGRVSDVTIKTSSGHKVLDQAARKAVLKWIFTPATLDGKNISSSLDLPVTFQLRNKS